MFITKPSLSSLLLLLAPICMFSLSASAADDVELTKQCKLLESISYETAADSPAVIMSATYTTQADKSLEFQFMFGKRSIVQGIPVGENVHELPPHCRIEGYIAPAVKFLILLPDPTLWNLDVLYSSCDAFCGAVDQDMPVPGLIKGFATIATDGGHINKRPFDGTWGYNNRQGEIDFGYQASHLAAQLIKAIANDYYQKDHRHAYITGFSKGGLAGVKSALTYPHDYNGILARSPVLRYQDINAIRLPWLYKVNSRADGSPILLAADAMLVHKAAIQSCDEVDGLKDGIIDDPAKCNFNPDSLLCAKNKAENCLSAEKVGVVKNFYSLPKNDKGEVVYPYPLAVGSELDWRGFHAPVSADASSFAEEISRTYIRYMAFEDDPGPHYDWKSFDPAVDGHLLNPMKFVYDANDPDLSAFRDAGGKMIIIHGLADGAVNARMTIDWFDRVRRLMGDSTSEFVQLYAVPGNKHGGSPGDGPNINESMAALSQWVETGTPPAKLIFRLENEAGEVTRTRPGYPYPAKAVYNGTGSIDAAENFHSGNH